MKFQKEFNQKIEKIGKIAVVQPQSVQEALEIAKKLKEKNIFALEIAYRNLENFSLTDECIFQIRKEFPELLVGAATVVNKKIAKRAKKAGAQFILSPGFNEKTVKWCIKNKIPVFPGVLTPSEIEKALNFGLNVLKFFPAECFGGLNYLKSLLGPFPNVKFIVSGGINLQNQEEYLKLQNVTAVSGSYLLKI